MSSTAYLLVMLGIIATVTVVAVPSIFWKKCPHCGERNGLDARECKQCGGAFPEDER